MYLGPLSPSSQQLTQFILVEKKKKTVNIFAKVEMRWAYIETTINGKPGHIFPKPKFSIRGWIYDVIFELLHNIVCLIYYATLPRISIKGFKFSICHWWTKFCSIFPVFSKPIKNVLSSITSCFFFRNRS
jgi:hypothetical protein